MDIWNRDEPLSIFICAGFATAPDFLDGFAAAIARRFEQGGPESRVEAQVRVRIYFPYGDWRRRGVLQLGEIASDLWRSAWRRDVEYGGRHLAAFVARHAPAEAPLLLIGHSGGGVASVHAAQQLAQEGRRIVGVIQIGSPKCAVPALLKPRALYIYAAQESGGRASSADPVTRIGTWGGWSARRFTGLRWDSRKHAPLLSRPLRLVGGHADYFRDHEPYVQSGRSNLQITMDTIWSWLHERYPEQFS